MIVICHFDADPRSVALAHAYWGRSEKPGWERKVKDVEKDFGIAAGLTVKEVNRIAHARVVDRRCSTCGQPLFVRTRNDYESIVRNLTPPDSAALRPVQCRDCWTTTLEAHLAATRAEKAAQQQRVAQWIADTEDRLGVRDYADISARHAFLLGGLLLHSGQAWKNPHLAPWNSFKVPLCAHMANIEQTFKELWREGWLIPNPALSGAGAWISDKGELNADWRLVSWKLPADLNDRSPEQLMALMQRAVSAAQPTQLREIWLSVCLDEFRAHFEFCQNRWRFGGEGWSDVVNWNYQQLLMVCSLGRAKSITWRSFNYLGGVLQRKEKPASHVFNMAAGNLLRAYDRYQTNGWTINSWKRLPVSKEPVYTSHLFDHVLGGGNASYDELTGEQFVDGQ